MSTKIPRERLERAFPAEQPAPGAKRAAARRAAALLVQETKEWGAAQNFVWNQLRSISGPFWAVQLFCFAALLWNAGEAGGPEGAQELFLTVVPILTFYMLPELLKARLCRTEELEGACRFSPARAAAVKLALISASNVLVITAAAAALGTVCPVSAAELLGRGLIPFHLALAAAVTAFELVKATSAYALLSVSTLLTVALMQLRSASFLLADHWRGAYAASAALAAFVLVAAAVRWKHMEGHRDGT